MIRVLAIVPYRIFPVRSGGQKGIASFYRYLSRTINLTCVGTIDNYPDDEMASLFFPILGTTGLRYFNPFVFFKIRKIIKKNFITHIMMDHPYLGWLAIWLKKSTGLPLITRSHNIEAQRFRSMGRPWWRLLQIYEQWVHKSSDISFFITDQDRKYAINRYNLIPERCTTITFGVEISERIPPNEKQAARSRLCSLYGINESDYILLFNGSFNYQPNRNGLDLILTKVAPFLNRSSFPYKIIICGNGIPNYVNSMQVPNIINAGFVDDITLYLKGAQIFLNPIIDGGGIKTKLVEALAYDLCCISFEAGAIGIPAEITGGKLRKVEDGNEDAFCDAITNSTDTVDKTTPPEFLDHFYWGTITQKAVDAISKS